MRIAHLSDPHLLDLVDVAPASLYRTKRITGMLTLKLHREGAHRGHIVKAMVQDINAHAYDHVAITGDITNLALDAEFRLAREVFDGLTAGHANVSVVPGNHDVYTRGSERTQRFARWFAPNITSDVPIECDHPSGPFPFVRLRGSLAIVGVSTAVARVPFVAAGRAGRAQLEAVAAALAHPEVRKRTPVVLVHHPLVNLPGFVLTPTHGLVEGVRIRRLLGRALDHGVVLHGHMHDRLHRELRSSTGNVLHHIGATSASLVHDKADRMAGYNVYEFDGAGRLERVLARVWHEATATFREQTIERRVMNERH